MRTQADHAEYDWHAGPSDDQIAAEMEADRCQQLAALEAEIGRLQIGAMMVSSLDDIVSDVSVVNNSPHNPHLWTHLWCLIEKEQDGLITRWRELHAEGAEEGGA